MERPVLEGVVYGYCYRTTCDNPLPLYYNKSTQQHYCRDCANDLNHENMLGSMQLYGTPKLCEVIDLSELSRDVQIVLINRIIKLVSDDCYLQVKQQLELMVYEYLNDVRFPPGPEVIINEYTPMQIIERLIERLYLTADENSFYTPSKGSFIFPELSLPGHNAYLAKRYNDEVLPGIEEYQSVRMNGKVLSLDVRFI